MNKTISVWNGFPSHNVAILVAIAVMMIYVDICVAQTQWTKYAENPVLDVGPDEWDDYCVANPTVLFDDSISIYQMWYDGHSGEGLVRIGYATSTDGINWVKYPDNPILDLGSPGEWDSLNLGNPSVLFDDTISIYKMWYYGFDGHMRIGYATSPDGVNWVKYDKNGDGKSDPVLGLGNWGTWDDADVWAPTVLFDGIEYKMWYSGNDGYSHRIGYATSPDGINWMKHPNPVLWGSASWEGNWVWSPMVLFNGIEYEMWYNGMDGSYVKIGYATSIDGINWVKHSDNPVLNVGPSGTWEERYVEHPTVLSDGSGYKMWYSGMPGLPVIGDITRIGYAVSSAYPDFWIDKINTVQVVWDPDINGDGSIDLVAGKSTMVRIEVGMQNCGVLNKQQIVKVNLTIPEFSAIFPLYTEEKTIEELEQDRRIDFFPPFRPDSIGNSTITAEVDPENEIQEANESNNESSVQITVKDTRSMHISYFVVKSKWPADYGAPDLWSFLGMANLSGEFILGTYPISEDKFTNEIRSEELTGSPIPWGEAWPWFGIQSDIKELSKLKARLGAGDRAVGVVSDDYFAYHGVCCETLCAKGVAIPFGVWDAVLVREGYPTATAHEIGHSYSLHLSCPNPLICPFLPEEDKARYFPGEEYEFDEDTCEITYEGNVANGSWVDKGEFIEDSICFMGTAPEQKDSLGRWIDDECYEKLFQRLRTNPQDPEDLLLISGTLFENGLIELDNWYCLESGMIDYTVDYPLPSDLYIQLLSWEGQIIEEIGFPVSFEVYANPFGVIETGTAPFVRVIPFPEDTLRIKLQYRDGPPVEFNPAIKLLHDSVNSIPHYGFVHQPEQSRNALHNKIAEVGEKIEQGDFEGAVHKLEFDIRDKAEKWLVDDYSVETPLQLTKTEIIGIVDEMINRISQP